MTPTWLHMHLHTCTPAMPLISISLMLISLVIALVGAHRSTEATCDLARAPWALRGAPRGLPSD